MPTADYVIRSQLRLLATTTVRLRSLTSRTAGGAKPTFGPWAEHSAQVRRPTTAERANTTETRTVEWVAVIPGPTLKAKITDEIELPGGEVRPVMTVESVRAPEADTQLAVKIMTS